MKRSYSKLENLLGLPKKFHSAPPALRAHLKCLQDCVQTEPAFKRDLQSLKKVKAACDREVEVLSQAIEWGLGVRKADSHRESPGRTGKKVTI